MGFSWFLWHIVSIATHIAFIKLECVCANNAELLAYNVIITKKQTKCGKIFYFMELN